MQRDSHTKTVSFILNGETVQADPNLSLLENAKQYKIRIPHLCYKKGYRADGNCRSCVVEIKGERTLAPACIRKPTEGMEVTTDNQRARHSQKIVVEMLASDMPNKERSPYSNDSKLDYWRNFLEIEQLRFPSRPQPISDKTHPAIDVNLDACIQCSRCVRACREEQANDVIGYAFRGHKSKIVFDMDDKMGFSSCVGCGECVQACPTGALMPAKQVGLSSIDKKIDSVCPYCGVGCLLSYHVKDNKVLYVTGRNGPANQSRLCVKGRYGYDYVHHPERLVKPLIRKKHVSKSDAIIPANKMLDYFQEVSWEEALDFAAQGLLALKTKNGTKALAAFGSAKGTNEEAYLLQKMVRTSFGNNNIDHCTRLCHASSVAALLEGIGSGAVSNQVADGVTAEVMIVIGSRTTENHPVAATFMKNVVRQQKSKLIVIEPYRSSIADFATSFLQINPSTDVALLNGMMHTIISEKIYNQEFIQNRTEGFEALRATVMQYSPERVAPICGIAVETIKETARLFAKAKTGIIFWGMGISQHTHGSDNTRTLIALALLTGHIGKPGTGLHPLRGQNNVQGASDMGLIPMYYPDYQSVTSEKTKDLFQNLWNSKLNPTIGLTVTEIIDAIHLNTIQGMYIMGENPAMSDPDLNHARKAMAKLEHLVVQDIFFTETCSYADVILPASTFLEKTGTVTNTDRRVQLGRQAVDLPGEAKQDMWIIQEIAKRMGLDWNYQDPAEVFEEIRSAVRSMSGITWQRLEQEDSLTYPLKQENGESQPIMFQETFPTPSGKARFVPAEYSRSDELPDQEYPFILITGRLLEHWHTGSMTRRSRTLDIIEPEVHVSIHPDDLEKLGANQENTVLKISSRRGCIELNARSNPGVQAGSVIIPFAFREAAANILTSPKIDPDGKIPSFKFCAVKIDVIRNPQIKTTSEFATNSELNY